MHIWLMCQSTCLRERSVAMWHGTHHSAVHALGVDDRTSTRSSSQVNVVQGVDAEVASAGACGADEEAGSSSL